jgi:hypothetical protein
MQMTCTAAPVPMTVRAPAAQLYSDGEGSIKKPEIQTQLLPFKAALASAQE